MLEPGGGPMMGALASKQHAVAKAEYGVFWRTLSNTTSAFRLNRIPNPPRRTSFPDCVPGLQAKPTRGPKLLRSGEKSRSPFLHGASGGTHPHTKQTKN